MKQQRLQLARDTWQTSQRAIVMLGALVLILTTHAAAASSDGYDDESEGFSLWPIGERHEVDKLKEEYVPFAGPDEIPARPGLFIEGGHPFLGTGPLIKGFEVPVLGAIWQPRLWSYMIFRTALQTFDNGAPGGQRETEWANRLDLFFNLQLTNTEKIILGFRPVDENRFGRFTRYSFDGTDEDDFVDEFNIDVETLFFEGDVGSLLYNLDRDGTEPIDFGFTVGRQPITFQEGILINDTVDAFGLVRNNIPLRGTSNFRVGGLWAWNRLNRNDLERDASQNMFGLFSSIDAPVSTFDLDFIYVDDSENGDGFYVGAAAIQRLRSLGNISSAFRVNASFALDDEIPGNVVGDGVLLTAEFSKTPHYSDDIIYFDPFLGIDNFTQAGREPIVGGPLANTGILFASASLSRFLAEIDPFTTDDVVGAALGYQAFWDNKRRNLTLETALKENLNDGVDSLGFGLQLQQAVGRFIQLQWEAFYVFNDGQDDGSGARFEFQLVY